MIKVIIFNIILFFGNTGISFAHTNSYVVPADTMIRITGKVINKDDSTSVPATILYQKLPYYDDMGMVSSGKSDGMYEMYMIKDTKYTLRITASGFDTIEEEYIVADGDNDGAIEKHFFISPDEDHKKISLDDLQFASQKATINKGSYEELDDLAKWLNEKTNKIIQLEGHTDFAGNATANMKLSQLRVEAVKDYLSNKGVKKNRIRTKAFGGTQPLSSERTPAAKAANRRVEVRILN